MGGDATPEWAELVDTSGRGYETRMGRVRRHEWAGL